jgi:hypothetical protein
VQIITTTPGPPPDGPQEFVRWVALPFWGGTISYAVIEVAGQYYLERAGQWAQLAEQVVIVPGMLPAMHRTPTHEP